MCSVCPRSCSCLVPPCLQVPQHLGQAAASAPDPFAPKSFAAVCALGVLIHKAVTEEALARSSSGTSLKGITSTLSNNMGQQLKQSGFLAALPRLLAAVAAALTDTQHDTAWKDVPQQLGVDPASVPAAVRQLLFLQELSTWLLLLTKECLCLFSQQLHRAAVAVPALRLCAAVMQLCSRCAEQRLSLQAQQRPLPPPRSS